MRIYMVGIGGMGMAPLAIYLAQSGHEVVGQDGNLPGRVYDLLKEAGVGIQERIPENTELLVYSSAVRANHPLREEAARREIPQIRRGEMLAEVIAKKKLIAVVGSHGKTTTTSLLIWALARSGLKADYVLGGLFKDDIMLPANGSDAEWIIAEVDESDGTIEQFTPEITVAVNFDWDHPEKYPQRKDLEDAFVRLFDRTRKAVFIPSECPILAEIKKQCSGTFFTYGGTDADFIYNLTEEKGGKQIIRLSGRFSQKDVLLNAPGYFNRHNAAAALSVVHSLGGNIGFETLADYAGVFRRQGVLLEDGSITVVEDYAHHPAEIDALIAFSRKKYAGRPLWMVFQPHRYTRTRQYAADFAKSIGLADTCFMLPVYSAGEFPLENSASETIMTHLPEAACPVRLFDNDRDLLQALVAEVPEGAVVLFVGAGSVNVTARLFIAMRCAPNNVFEQWKSFLGDQVSKETVLRLNEPLANKTTFRLGGNAACYAEPVNRYDLQRILRAAKLFSIKHFIMGLGSNVLVPDEGFRGLVIRLADSHWRFIEYLDDGRFYCMAGASLKRLSAEACKQGIGGFEFMEGIPASVGGALRMNAGAMGGSMFDRVESIDFLNENYDFVTLPRSAFNAEYRHCHEIAHATVIGAILVSAERKEPESIRATMNAFMEKRRNGQPLEPSAGCVFKNQPDYSAGKLIDECGLKGKRVGGAEVSPMHANFIVNRDHATAGDVLALAKQIHAIVLEKRGVDLEPEVFLLGKDWADVWKS